MDQFSAELEQIQFLLERILSCFLATIAYAVALAADQTWIGQISDSMCGASHSKMTGAHPG